MSIGVIEIAVKRLRQLKAVKSEYVGSSAGNALRAIRREHQNNDKNIRERGTDKITGWNR